MSARNVKEISLKTSTDSGTTWVEHKVIETPTVAPETVSEEECTAFGDEYKDYLPTVKDRELLVVKLRDDGDSTAGALVRGCVLSFRLYIKFSDRACGTEGTVEKDLLFTAYIQKRESDMIVVGGNRIAAISLSLRLKTAMAAYVAPVVPGP